VVVVSEETGAISLALEGQLISNLSVEALKERMLVLLQPEETDQGRWFWRRESGGLSTPTDSAASTPTEEVRQ